MKADSTTRDAASGVDVVGVLAVLHRPMGERSVYLGDPGPALCGREPVSVHRGDVRVGEVSRVWRDGDLIRYTAVLDVAYEEVGELADEIGARRLVGLMDAAHGSMGYERGAIVVSGWQVAGVSLLDASSRPWPEVTLSLT